MSAVSPSTRLLFLKGVPLEATYENTVFWDTATGATGGTVQVTATVATTNFAPQEVVYTSDNAAVTVTASGLATVPAGTSAGTAKITATSAFDNTKKAVCPITIK